MEIILLLGLVVLIVLYARLAARVGTLEAQLKAQQPSGDGLGVSPGPSLPEAIERPEQDRAHAPLAPEQRRPAPAAAPLDADAVDAALAEEAEARAAPVSLAGLFESFVGGRLLIWIGGIALAVAGIFLVRFSAGLITPAIRMLLAAIFGLALLAAGELARSRPGRLPDPRVPQALVGAGILVLYAAPYGALVLYQLISIGTASTLMVMVTAAALALSLRHGAPTAVMGLAGGFATPLLVGDPDAGAIPLLGYLALLDIALFAIASRRGWTWLAACAVLLSFVWTGFLLGEPSGDALAAGTFILLLSVGGSMLRTGPGWQLDFIRPALLGLVELAVLVARTDLGLPAWLLFATLSAASFLLATRRSDFRPIPAVALALALLLILFKVQLGKEILPKAAGVTLLFAIGAVPLALRRPERTLWVSVASAAFAGPILIFQLRQPGMLPDSGYGIATGLLALGPLLLAWRMRSLGEARAMLVAAATGLGLAALACFNLLPRDWVGPAWLVLALATAWAGGRGTGARLDRLAALAAALALAWTALRVPMLWTSLFGSLVGIPALASTLPGVGKALLVLALPAPLLAGLWRLLPADRRRLRAALLSMAGLCLTLFVYVLFKQAWGLRDQADFVARGFAERLIVTQALFAAGWAICRFPVPGLGDRDRRTAGILLTAAAAARLLWFDVLIDNPAVLAQSVGAMPVLNLLLPAYLLSAFWLYAARRGADDRIRSGLWLALSLIALVLGVMLMVRQGFQGTILTAPHIPSEESYGYSLAGLLLSLGLLLSGVRLPDKALRIAGLLLLTGTTLKVFLIDASALEGLLRILSFLGLGLALIGIGKLYTRVLDAERASAGARRQGE